MHPDEKWMTRALQLAEKGRGFVHPNPMVGAVVVKGGRLIGQGYHARFGEAHAEVVALRQAGKRARGATLYVTLEPCAHWGKTPPCIGAVIRAGVRRVVAAMRDPNPLVAGRGFSALRKAGIAIATGVQEGAAKRLNRAFVTRLTRGRPYVTLKVASSLDGKIATSSGESRWITEKRSREMGHRLRAEVDAIAVGLETIRRDNPELTTHGQGRNPIRVVFDSRLRTPAKAKILSRQARTWILTTPKAPAARRIRLERTGARVLIAPADRQGRLHIGKSLQLLSDAGIAHLLVEGGGTLNAAFLAQDAVDEVLWFVAPLIIGGTDARPAIGGSGAARLRDAWRFKNVVIGKTGGDFVISAERERKS